MKPEMKIVDHTGDNGFENTDSGFDDTFGQFDATGSDTQYRPAIVKKVDDGRAHPCNGCGGYPKLHDVFFKDKVAHPNHFYISCGNCDDCDGEWYASEEDAIAAWNAMNPLENVDRKTEASESRDFADDIITHAHFTD